LRIVQLVTGLGDSALLLPGSLALLGYLVWRGQRALALAWLATLALCLGLTALAKLAFLACGEHVPALRVDSPSGHASFSAAFYGACAVVASFHRPRWQRLLIHAGALVLVLAIAASRTVLRHHSVEEVLSGLVIGGVCVLAFAMLGRPAEPAPVRLAPLAVGVVALAALVAGRHLSAEPLLERIAARLAPSLGCSETVSLSPARRTASWSPSR
jgi:membrane-associated phospholipid phosphatase